MGPSYDKGLDNAMVRTLSAVAKLDPPSTYPKSKVPLVDEKEFQMAHAALRSCMLVRTTERFDETIVLLARDMGWSLPDMVYQRRNVTLDPVERSTVSERTCERILYWNQWDLKLYETARRLTDERITTYVGNFQRDLATFERLNPLFSEGADLAAIRELEFRCRTEAGLPTLTRTISNGTLGLNFLGGSSTLRC